MSTMTKAIMACAVALTVTGIAGTASAKTPFRGPQTGISKSHKPRTAKHRASKRNRLMKEGSELAKKTPAKPFGRKVI